MHVFYTSICLCVSPGAYYGTRLRYAGIEIRTTLTAGTKDFQAGLDIYNAWEKFVSDEVGEILIV